MMKKNKKLDLKIRVVKYTYGNGDEEFVGQVQKSKFFGLYKYWSTETRSHSTKEGAREDIEYKKYIREKYANKTQEVV